MKLVTDTNVLFSAITYDGLERVISESPRFEFIVTMNVVSELKRLLAEKIGMDGTLVSESLRRVPLRIVEDRDISGRIGDAEKS